MCSRLRTVSWGPGTTAASSIGVSSTEVDQWTIDQDALLPLHKVRGRRSGVDRTLRLRTDRRSCRDHNPGEPSPGMGCRNPALVLLCPATDERPPVVAGRHLVGGYRLLHGDPGHTGGFSSVPAIEPVQTPPSGVLRAVPGTHALALHHRDRLRRLYTDLGVQRPAFDGPMGLGEWRRPGDRTPAASARRRRLSRCRRSPQPAPKIGSGRWETARSTKSRNWSF